MNCEHRDDCRMAKRIESADLLRNHPDKIPIVIKPHNSAKNKFGMVQSNFLVPKLYSFHEFVFLIRKKLRLDKSEALYITVNSIYLPGLFKSISSLYVLLFRSHLGMV